MFVDPCASHFASDIFSRVSTSVPRSRFDALPSSFVRPIASRRKPQPVLVLAGRSPDQISHGFDECFR